MNYKKKALQLIYSKYEEVMELKENYIEGRDAFIIVGEDKSAELLFNSLQGRLQNVDQMTFDGLINEKDKVIERLNEINGCIVFPYVISEMQRSQLEKWGIQDVIESGIEYFANKIDPYLENASLFDIGSNGISLALDLFSNEESHKVLYYRTCGILSDLVNKNAFGYDEIISMVPCDKEHMMIANESIEIESSRLESEIKKYEKIIKNDKVQCILPLGDFYSNLWRIPIYMKQMQPEYTMSLIHGGIRCDDTYLYVG